MEQLLGNFKVMPKNRIKNNTNSIDGKVKNKGFSIIELIIVISIIGVLAGIIAIRYSNVQKNAKVNADYANASAIATAVALGENDGKASTDLDTVDELVTLKYLQNAPKPQSVAAQEFTINIQDGNVVVSAAGKSFYPKYDEKKDE